LGTLAMLGAVVDVMPPVPGLGDMVFVRDGAVVLNGWAIKGRFRHRSRRREADEVMAWLDGVGYLAADLPLPGDACLEGGDVAVFDRHLLIGWGFRTNRTAHAALAGGLGIEVHSLRLIDPRFYHLDTCFCPLDERHALVATHAFDSHSRRLIQELVPEPLELGVDESLQLCANAVVLDRTVVMSHCPPRLATLLHDHGFDVRAAPVEEFKKSGGAVSCLTLPLDRHV
jgi:N-dimethylarginine dimethylaminohydrolase